MKKTFTFLLALTLLTIVGTVNAQNNNGTSTNTNANANANVNATGSGSSAVAPGDPSVFGNGFWNVYCYNGNMVSNPTTTTYYGYYTENNLSFNSKNRWASSPSSSPTKANTASGNSYTGITPLGTIHTISYKRTGITSGFYKIDIADHDDWGYLYINGALVWNHKGCCDSHADVWTGFLEPSTTIEFKWVNVATWSSGALDITMLNSTAGALPVELLNVKADKKDNSVLISWNAASENNVKSFVVEKTSGLNDQIITEVTTVDAKGNSSSISNYNAIDNNPTTGTSYYRIKSIDFDGSVQYSEFVKISNENTSFEMEVYPNPTNSQNINITLNNISSDASITLIDAMGNTVYTQTSSSSTFNLNAGQSIIPGVYQVVATLNNETISKRLIVQ